MLGRSVGLSEAKIAHIGDDPLPEGVYEPAEAAIVRYARTSTLTLTVDRDTYEALARSFTIRQILQIWGVVASANAVNRFHATFHTDLDESTLAAVEAGDRAAGSCPLPRPAPVAD